MAKKTQEYKEFARLVKFAEKFIVEGSGDILYSLRKKKSKKEKISEECYELLKYKKKYFPKFVYNKKYKKFVKRTDKNHLMDINDIIMRFCQELQNYQAMPKAIDFISYSYDIKKNQIDIDSQNNEIFNAIIEFLKGKDDNYFNNKQNEKNQNIDAIDKKYGKDKNKSLIPLTYNFDLYKFMRNKLHFKENKEINLTNDGNGFLLNDYDECQIKSSATDKRFNFSVERYKKNGNGYKKDEIKSYLYNQAWYKYTRGLMDVLIQIKLIEQLKANGNDRYKDIDYVEFVKCICEDIQSKCKNLENCKDNEFKENFKEIENIIHEFNGKLEKSNNKNIVNDNNSKDDNEDGKDNNSIFYLGDTLTYDFLKELACENLVKADIHIKELFNKAIYKKDGENEVTNEKVITRDFIKLCNEYNSKYIKSCKKKKMKTKINYTPFYIDKMFWLCCTGNFYADGITITKMTRNNFLKFAGY